MVNLSKCQLTRQKPSKPPQIIHPQKISSANIRKYQAKYPDKEIDLRGDIADLRRFFWREEIQEVVYDIETNIEKARSALGRVRAVKNPEALASLLNPLAHAAIQTLQEREQTLKFLEEYTSPQATNERLWR